MDDELTPEQIAEAESMLRPYQDVELAAFNFASARIGRKNKEVTVIYRQIIDSVRERFNWIPHPSNLQTDIDKRTFVEADRAIKEGIREAIAAFKEEQAEERNIKAMELHDEGYRPALSPADAIRAWLTENDYLPPVKCLALFSKVAPTDERAFYNAIQNNLRAEGWQLEVVGRGQGYQVTARPEIGQKIEEAVELLKYLNPETLEQVLLQMRSSLDSDAD